MKKRNSLIELYRFLFALNVLKGHGMFPYQGPYFGPASISVEFFFVLSGFLLLGSIKKYLDLPFLKAFSRFIFSKIKPLIIPLIITIPFNIAYSLITNNTGNILDINIWGFLWYIKTMLLVFTGYFILRYFIRKEWIFNMILVGFFITSAILHIMPEHYDWGIVRAAMSISLGMIMSYIPKINIDKPKLLWLALIPIQIAILIIMFFGYSKYLIIEEILDLILYPALIYITFQIPFNNKVLNYLGSLSFGLYAFQCVCRTLVEIGLKDIWTIFLIIVILTLAEDSVKRLYKHYKNKQKLSVIGG